MTWNNQQWQAHYQLACAVMPLRCILTYSKLISDFKRCFAHNLWQTSNQQKLNTVKHSEDVWISSINITINLKSCRSIHRNMKARIPPKQVWEHFMQSKPALFWYLTIQKNTKMKLHPTLLWVSIYQENHAVRNSPAKCKPNNLRKKGKGW